MMTTMNATFCLIQQTWWNRYRYLYKIIVQEHLNMSGLVKPINLFIFFKRNKYFPGGIIRGPERYILNEQIQRSK